MTGAADLDAGGRNGSFRSSPTFSHNHQDDHA